MFVSNRTLGRVWETTTAADYAAAFDKFGGSFATHPRVVSLIEKLAERPVRYRGIFDRGELVAAVPLWGAHIVATTRALRYYRASHLIDVGDAEVVLPVSTHANVKVPFEGNLISPLHAENVTNSRRDTRYGLMLAKGLQVGEERRTRESQSKLRRSLRRFEEAGGSARPIGTLSPQEISSVFAGFSEGGWGFAPRGTEFLPIVLNELRDMLAGFVLYFGGRPIAIHLLYKVETPKWIFANGVSQGSDPEFKAFAPGSVLTFLNLQSLESEAQSRNKQLRYNFGLSNKEYKMMWCYEIPAYRLRQPFYQWNLIAMLQRKMSARVARRFV
jgi:Mig-14